MESIEQHAEFMWKNRYIKGLPEKIVDERGMEVIEIGMYQRSILEELEKAHIYIEQLHERTKALEENLVELEARLNAEK